MPTTPIYNLFYAEPGQNTGAVVHEEQKRWLALETLLFEIYSIFDNGVLNGWTIEDALGPDNTIYITAGSGHIGFKSAYTNLTVPVSLSIPPGITIDAQGLTFYIFGKETENTPITREVEFFASTNMLVYDSTEIDQRTIDDTGPGGVIEIGEVVLKYTDTTGYYIDPPKYEYRNDINLFASLGRFIRNHVHIGGANDPEKINLRRHVKGKLSGDQIASIDADKIRTGTISPDRMPQFSHNELSDKGVLKHDQLDTLIAALDLNTDHYLNDTADANFLQMVIMLKHIFITVDELFMNLIAFIPGYSDASWIDPATTALIDNAGHRIMGYLANPASSDYVTWGTKAQFEQARDEHNDTLGDYLDSGIDSALDAVRRSSNIDILDEGVQLSKSLNLESIDDTEDATPWYIIPQVLNSSFGSTDGSQVNVNVNIGIFVFKLFTETNGTILPQNWLGSSRMEFSFKLEFDPALESPKHGNIGFFLIGAPPKGSGVSYTTLTYATNKTIIVNSGLSILNADTETDDFKKVFIDMGNFDSLGAVQGFGFYATTLGGWDANAFEVQLKQPEYTTMIPAVSDELKAIDSNKTIQMYRYNDLYYDSDGFLLFRFNSNLTARWDFVYWAVDIPSMSISGSVVYPSISVKTRVADTEAGLIGATFKEVNSVTHMPDQLDSKWIDIQITFVAGGNTYARTFSPLLQNMTLYYTVSSSSTSHTWSTYEDWILGYKMLNISALENPDHIEIEDTSYVNSKYFIEGNSVKTVDDTGETVPALSFDGSTLYRTPIQVFYNAPTGFITPSQVTRLATGNYLIVDSGNDRVVEITPDGVLEKAIQGNGYLALKSRDLVILTGSYNSRLGEIALTFSQRVMLSSFNWEKISLTSEDGTNVLFLNEEGTEYSTFGSCLVGNTSGTGGSSGGSGGGSGPTPYTASLGDINVFTGSEENIPGTFKSGEAVIQGSGTAQVFSTSEVATSGTEIPGTGTIGTSIAQNVTSEGEVIIVTLSDNRRLQVNSWGDSKRVIFATGAYTPSTTTTTTTTGGTTSGGTTGGTSVYAGPSILETLYVVGGSGGAYSGNEGSTGNDLGVGGSIGGVAGYGGSTGNSGGSTSGGSTGGSTGGSSGGSSDPYGPGSGTITGGTTIIQGYNPFLGGTEGSRYTYQTGTFYEMETSTSASLNPYEYYPYVIVETSNTDKIIVDPRYPVGYNAWRFGSAIANSIGASAQSVGTAQVFSNDEFSETELWLHLGDFDKDGKIDKNTLIDANGDSTIIEIELFDADIIYHDILNPVSAEKQSDDSYIIAQPHRYSIVNIDMNKNILWYILDTTANFEFGQFGSARYLTSASVLVASPPSRMIMEISMKDSVVLDYYNTVYRPQEVIRVGSSNLIIVAETTGSQLNSRAYIIDNTDNITWEWGNGKLILPTGCSYIPNGNVIVSC